MKEHVLKQENDDNDYDKIIDRFFSGCQDNNSNYVATGSLDHKILKCPFIQVFTHPKEKLNDHQVPLYVFFKGNPCPAHQPWPSLSTVTSSAVTFAKVDTSATTTQANNQHLMIKPSYSSLVLIW